MQLRPYQNAALKAIQEEFDSGIRSTLLVLPTGTGKCLGRGTPVLLYDGGIRKVEHIRPGDLLMGPDSLPRRVLSICRGEEEMFRIVPTKGDPYIVNRSHILSLKLTGEKSRYSRKGQIVNLSVEEYLQKSNHFKHIAKGWRTGVEFRERPVGLDPYLLGAWLGDGSIRSPAITTADDEIVDALIDAAVASKCTIAVQKGRSGKAATYSVSGPITGRSLNKVNRFREWLNNYGLLGCPEKHIPELYKANSRKVQLEVLAGLMDSDGHLTTGGFDYISKSKRLAEDVVFVARSVGLAAYMTECIKGCWYGGEYKTGTYHRVSISGDCSIIPTRIPRKKCPPRRQKKNVLVTGIKVESIGMGEYFGFELDGDGLFLLGDFTVTHNTVVFTSFAAAVRERSQKPVLVLAHRTELITQAAASLHKLGLVPKVEKAEQSATGYYDAVVASVQTLSRPNRLRKFRPDHFGLIVTDEAHHAPGATYRAIYDHFRDAPHLGVTATPNRHDEIGLKNIFQSCAFQYSIKQAIVDGWLVPVRGQQIAVESLHLEELKIVAGDFSQPEIDAMLRQEQTLQEMVVPTIEYAKDRPTIVFTPSVAHAHEIAACFNRLGAKAVAIDGSMPADERAKRLKSYETGESQFIVNVGVLTEGYDHPPTACIALFRPTKSLGLFAQMIGRGTRLAPGKSDCIILDFVGVGNTVRTVTVMDVLDGTKLSDKEHEKAQELQAAGKNSLEALDEAKQYVASLDSVRAKMRALTTSNAFDVLSMFAVPSAKGLYGGDPATERQIAYLTRVGIKCPPDLEKGEASKLIEALIDRQESGLATFKQIRYLKKLGVTHPDIDAWSFKQASEEINARVNARGFARG